MTIYLRIIALTTYYIVKQKEGNMRYFRSYRNLALLAVLLFFLSSISGFIVANYMPLIGSEKDLINHEGSLGLAMDLFFNNMKVCVILMLGIFTFAIPTLFYLIFNGFFLGMGIKSLMLVGLSSNEIALHLIPHAVLEIPAFLLAGMIGLNGLTFYFKPRIQLKPIIISSILVFILIFIAAMIEGLFSAEL